MEIDTCPMCGGEVWVRDNPHIEQSLIEKIPETTVFEIADGCGYFRLIRRDQTSLENDWVAEYIINRPHPNDDKTITKP